MIYKVRAKIIEETIGEFYRKLADGTVAQQRPDGEEITASMKRAVLTAPGVAEWYEKCFCATPLYHERQTQYDFYFTDMTLRRRRPSSVMAPQLSEQLSCGSRPGVFYAMSRLSRNVRPSELRGRRFPLSASQTAPTGFPQ